ncbi:hypothetical protein [Flintibacter muris]|uniref:hypothetical protein n=1 Tax=Flintibacter muris TaxID=2941327 RepID=UPI00203D81FA|nr:hypothetical protein [Flintibacter muris]
MILERKSKFSLSSQAVRGKINHHLWEKVIILGIKDFFKISGDQWGLPSDHLEGLGGASLQERIRVFTDKNSEWVEFEVQKNKTILPFSQIVQVNFIPWEKTITKALNPLAEGIVGGLIGGETMAVVSAIDAKGRTRAEKVKVPHALEIQYHPKGDFRTVKSIILDPVVKSMAKEWVETLRKYANLPEPRYITPQPKGPTYL